MELTVHELLAAAQEARKAKLDAGRVDTVFKVGDLVLLLTNLKELLDAADIGKLRPRWDHQWTLHAGGPGHWVPKRPQHAYTLALPRRMRCRPTVNIDRLTASGKPWPSTSVLTLHLLRARRRCRARGRRASTQARWSCCSTCQCTARRLGRGVLRATVVPRTVARPHISGS
jgi:hypothetical protein